MPDLFGNLETAWSRVHDATPPGWRVGRPLLDERRREWVQYAYDPRERARAGHRLREWTAVATSEIGVLEEMARCLAAIRDGRVPE